MLLRRGPKDTALVLGPVAALMVAWLIAFGVDSASETAFDGRAVRLALDRVDGRAAGGGAVGALGWLLVVVGVGGGVVATFAGGVGGLRGRWAVLGGLAVSVVFYLGVTSVGRAAASQLAASRYCHILFALMLPILGVGLTEVTSRWRAAPWVVAALMVFAIPGNVDRFEYEGVDRFGLGSRGLTAALVDTEAPPSLPRDVEPLGWRAEGVTVGWLEQVRAEDKGPSVDRRAEQARAEAELLLSMEPIDSLPGAACRTVGAGGRPVAVDTRSAGHPRRPPPRPWRSWTADHRQA